MDHIAENTSVLINKPEASGNDGDADRIKQLEDKIQELEAELERYKVELEYSTILIRELEDQLSIDDVPF